MFFTVFIVLELQAQSPAAAKLKPCKEEREDDDGVGDVDADNTVLSFFDITSEALPFSATTSAIMTIPDNTEINVMTIAVTTSVKGLDVP